MKQLLACGVAAIVIFFCASIVLDPTSLPMDLMPSICAGRVAASGVDPYLAGPMGACERAVDAEPAASKTFVFFPSPIAPPVVLVFESVASWPIRLTVLAYAGLVCLAFAASVVALARTLSLPWWLPGAALVCVDFAENASLGQLVPFAVALISLAGWALAAERPRLAALFATLALFQANFGVPAVIAMAIFVPRARLALAAGVAAFATISATAGGLPELAEFAGSVVPAQTLGELAYDNQIGLGWMLWTAGVSAPVALRIAEVQSVLIDIAGIWASRAVARHFRQPAAIVFVPAAAAVAFGPYLHPNHLALAVPLLLLLAVKLGPRSRRFAAIALGSISLPIVLQQPWVAASLVLVLLAAAQLAWPVTAPERLVAIAALTFVFFAGFERAAKALPGTLLRVRVDPAAYAASVDMRLSPGRSAFERYLAGRQEHPSLPYLAIKLPLWFGSIVLIALTLRTATAPASRFATARRPDAPMGNQSRAEGG